MGQITKVTPNMIGVANNVTSTTVGNTTQGISLTFDGSGVITSASNVTLSVANTQLTGTITGTQLAANSVNSSIIAANTISNTNIATGTVENYLRGANLDFGMRNRIINGAMVIDQRNAGSSVTANTTGLFTYTLDRWYYVVSQATKISIQQNAGSVTPPAGFNNYLGVTSLASTSLGASDYYIVGQSIEGFNYADWGWGTANARPVTLSFWVRSSLTGTFGAVFRNGNDNRVYGFTYTINSANTWEQKSITIPGDTSGTWAGATNGVGVKLFFGLGLGSSESISAGTWTTSGAGGVTGATSVVGTNGATWYITGVQLEEGSVSTPFEYRHYGTELQLCQRYCPVVATTDRLGLVSAYASTFAFFSVRLSPPTRTPPTGVSVSGNYIMYTNGTPYSSLTLSFDGSGSNEFATITVNGTSLPTTGAFELRRLNGTNLIILTGCEL